jgi:hypothetical protein
VGGFTTAARCLVSKHHDKPGEAWISRSQLIRAAALALMTALPLTAWAAETAPGDACVVGETDLHRFVGGPENPGTGYHLVCNGTTWEAITTWDSASSRSLFQVNADAGACTAVKEGRLRYVDGSNRIELCDDLNWVTYGGGSYALTDGATIAVDWNNGNTQSVTLGGNRTFTFANPQVGARYTLLIKQDGTGSRTATWPATARWPGGVAPTLTTTASKTDWIGFVYNGVDSKYDGVAISQNY